MIFSKSLPYEDIVKNLDKEKDSITIVGCNTCIRVAGAGGPEKMKEMAQRLKKDGYNVKDGYMLPIACMEPYLMTAKFRPDVNTIVALCCTAGALNIKRNYPSMKVVETVDHVGLMVADANKGALKIAMPYEKYLGDLGKEYVIGSDGKEELKEEQISLKLGVK